MSIYHGAAGGANVIAAASWLACFNKAQRGDPDNPKS